MSKVSICIPVYNGSAYLDTCIESAVKQTYSDFEIIIVDDQSTDNSIEVIKKWQEKYNNIFLYINEINQGLTGNWNACMDYASGEWIKFLFQDDYLKEDCLEKMMKHSQQAPIISCDRTFIFENSVDDVTKAQYVKLSSPTIEFHLQGPEFISAATISRKVIQRNSSNFIGEPTSVLFRKDQVNTIGKFNHDYKQICDLEYWIRISSQSGLFHIPENLAFFRVHGASTSNENKKTRTELGDGSLFMYDLIYSKRYDSFRIHLQTWNELKLKIIMSLRLFELKTLGRKNVLIQSMISHIYTIRPDLKDKLLPDALSFVLYQFILLKRMLFNR